MQPSDGDQTLEWHAMLSPHDIAESAEASETAARILLVEDDDLQREAMAHGLRFSGLDVDECSTVEQALAKYRGSVFDVVVTDLRLQGSSGLDLIQRLREADPFASAVVVTQYADMSAAIAALREGAVDFVAKPFRPDELRAAVQRALGYRAVVKKNEQLRQALQEQLVLLAHANEQLHTFAGRVAHDLRAPVRSTRLWAQFAAEALESGDVKQASEYLNSSIRSIGAGTAIIDSLLALSKSDALKLKPEDFSLLSVVETVVESCRLEFNERAFDVTTKVDGSVMGDPVLLGIAVTNLIHNAFKYSSQQSEPRLDISAGPVVSGYRFTVQDNGVGIDPTQKDQLFQPFVRLQTARQFSGEGLGLTTVKKIIERHGGTVSLDSSIGLGTTATFHLPDTNPCLPAQPMPFQDKERA